MIVSPIAEKLAADVASPITGGAAAEPPGGDTTAPTITSASALTHPEGAGLLHALTADEAVTWTIVGGADAALFSITDATLSMAAKNFETPVDADANNSYVVTVRATDGASNTTDQTITVTVTYDPVTVFGVAKASLYDPSDLSTLWQDTGRTIQAGLNDPVRVMDDLSGNGYHVTAPTDAARPVLKQSGAYFFLDFDGIDDELRWSGEALDMSRNVGGITITAAYRFKTATASTGWIMNQTATAATSARAGMSRNSAGTLLVAGGRRLNANSFAFVSTGNTTAVQVSTAIFEYAASDLFLHRGGSVVASSTSFQTDGLTDDTRAFSGGIGSTGAGTGFLDMEFYGGSYAGFKIGAAEKESHETYLASKNGAPLI